MSFVFVVLRFWSEVVWLKRLIIGSFEVVGSFLFGNMGMKFFCIGSNNCKFSLVIVFCICEVFVIDFGFFWDYI